MTLLTYCLWLLGAYLIGSVPFGLLLGKLKGVDIRDHGSGNVGATNAGRVLGKKIGLLCFVLDVVKGLGPTLAFGIIAGATHGVDAVNQSVIDSSLAGAESHASPGVEATTASLSWLGIAAAAVVGHVFPVWLKFKGGKGVATSLGVLLGVFPYLTLPALAGFVVWFITLKASGYVGLASVFAAIALPLLTVGSCLAFGLGLGPTGVFFGVTVLLAALVIVRHRGNLQRIRAGTEPKAGTPKDPAL